MTAFWRAARFALPMLLASTACARNPATPPSPAPARIVMHESPPAHGLGATTQLVLVTTATWDTTAGTLRRFERAATGDAWRPVGAPVSIVVGRTGLAWDDAFVTAPGTPVKREGEGRAPAGVFPLDTVFGFFPAAEAAWVRMPYAPLREGSECVDDVTSAHYNTIVDRSQVARVDWTSAERMRAIGQYALGVTVGYNAAPPRAGRGSCIFLHIWAGPGSYTAGCTAMSEHDLRDLVLWLDRARRPVIVQLPTPEYERVRSMWGLP